MTRDEFRDALRSLGLCAEGASDHRICIAAAKRWGMHPRSIERRWYGELPVPGWMEHLIRLESGEVGPLCGRGRES